MDYKYLVIIALKDKYNNITIKYIIVNKKKH